MNPFSLAMANHLALTGQPFYHHAPPEEKVQAILIRHLAVANDPKVPKEPGPRRA